MPLFIDIHHIGDPVDIDDAAHDHAADVRAQGHHDVHFLRYWVSEAQGMTLCLVDAPYAEAVRAVHRQARGYATDEVYQVLEGA